MSAQNDGASLGTGPAGAEAGATPDGMAPHVATAVEETARLDSRSRLEMGKSDHFAELMTRFGGSMLFVWLHVTWFGIWIVLNVTGVVSFDNFPFGFLTMIVSLEAIFLSTFVLISQNRQAIEAERRAKVDLQVNMIAEQEITKILALVAELHDSAGLGQSHDEVIEHMQKPTAVEALADAVEAAEAETKQEQSDAIAGERGVLE